jgi:hypothetical protein
MAYPGIYNESDEKKDEKAKENNISQVENELSKPKTKKEPEV